MSKHKFNLERPANTMSRQSRPKVNSLTIVSPSHEPGGYIVNFDNGSDDSGYIDDMKMEISEIMSQFDLRSAKINFEAYMGEVTDEHYRLNEPPDGGPYTIPVFSGTMDDLRKSDIAKLPIRPNTEAFDTMVLMQTIAKQQKSAYRKMPSMGEDLLQQANQGYGNDSYQPCE